MPLLSLYYKMQRRLSLAWASLSRRMYLVKQRALHKDRVQIDSSFEMGDRFALVFDASSSTVQIGRSVLFRDFCQIRSGCNSRLVIGDNVFFNNGCTLNCFGAITIGNNNQFGENVKFYDVNHAFKDKSKPISEQGYTDGAITIGNNCWIGANVTILRNVTIGDNTVIGAGCVVHKSVPANTVMYHEQNLVHKPY